MYDNPYGRAMAQRMNQIDRRLIAHQAVTLQGAGILNTVASLLPLAGAVLGMGSSEGASCMCGGASGFAAGYANDDGEEPMLGVSGGGYSAGMARYHKQPSAYGCGKPSKLETEVSKGRAAMIRARLDAKKGEEIISGIPDVVKKQEKSKIDKEYRAQKKAEREAKSAQRAAMKAEKEMAKAEKAQKKAPAKPKKAPAKPKKAAQAIMKALAPIPDAQPVQGSGISGGMTLAPSRAFGSGVSGGMNLSGMTYKGEGISGGRALKPIATLHASRMTGGMKRSDVVKQVMTEKGLGMIAASKYVKAHGLY